MRHNLAHRKLGRVSEHRTALLRNQAMALIRHERIETTMPKAKELRPFLERLITIAKRGVAAGDANGKSLHARRLVLAELPDKAVVGKLFESIAPRYAERPGGYTRILRVGFRRGDSAEVAQVELVGSEYRPKSAEEQKAEKEAATAAKTRSVGDRLRSAARGLRGSGAKGDQAAGSKGQAGGQTRGKAQKSTTPRKAGGS
jgi:large subunit ribosomal protein L17